MSLFFMYNNIDNWSVIKSHIYVFLSLYICVWNVHYIFHMRYVSCTKCAFIYVAHEMCAMCEMCVAHEMCAMCEMCVVHEMCAIWYFF